MEINYQYSSSQRNKKGSIKKNFKYVKSCGTHTHYLINTFMLVYF